MVLRGFKIALAASIQHPGARDRRPGRLAYGEALDPRWSMTLNARARPGGSGFSRDATAPAALASSRLKPLPRGALIVSARLILSDMSGAATG